MRYAAAVRRACENGDLPLVRVLFTQAAEVAALRQLLPREVEVELGRLLAPRYRAGASLLVLGSEIGRSAQYVKRLLRLAGVAMRPARRPARDSPPVDLVELRRRYENGSSIASLAHQFHYSRETIRKFLLAAGAEIRPNGTRQPVRSPSASQTRPGRGRLLARSSCCGWLRPWLCPLGVRLGLSACGEAGGPEIDF